MRVLHVIGAPLNSGAGRGVYWLHKGLLQRGIESRVLARGGIPGDPTVIALEKGALGNLRRIARNRLGGLHKLAYPKRQNRIFSTGNLGVNLIGHPEYQAAEVVNLHWINDGALSLNTISRIDKPLVWTLRDMWPFTGGCHYSMDCVRYREGCGACPQLQSTSPTDLSARIIAKKRNLPRSLTAIGISSWIADCARTSAVMHDMDIRVIANCIDSDLFKPLDKVEARNRLGLPLDVRIVLSGAINPAEFYKGYDLYSSALSRLSDAPWAFCEFGQETETASAPVPITRFGKIVEPEKLRAIYAAADVFVLPSRQEAFGKTAAEALACGTPVVAFDATGPRDIVEHRVTGWLATPFDPSDLAAGLRWVLEDPERLNALSRAAAQDGAERFGHELAADRYESLYREILARSMRPSQGRSRADQAGREVGGQ